VLLSRLFGDIVGKLSIKLSLVVLLIISIAGVVAPMSMSLKALKEQMLSDRKENLKYLVDTAHSTIKRYEKEAKEGKITEDEAKKAATQAVADLRYADGNYFWINTDNEKAPVMIMHPTVSKLNGKELTDKKFDCAVSMQFGDNGEQVALENKNLFSSMATVCNKNGSGYVKYMWSKPKTGGGATEELYPKISYVKKSES